jgi:hypothetical protein
MGQFKMQTRVRFRRSVAWLTVCGVGMSLVAAMLGSPAYANATSGWVYGVTHASVTYCGEATITDARYAAGYIESNSGSSCGQDYSSPGGYLGVLDYEGWDGSYCGGAANYLNNSDSASHIGQGGYWCGDEGHGTYDSWTDNEYWNSTYDEYYGIPQVTSPGDTTDVVSGGSAAAAGSNSLEGPIPAADFNGGPLTLASLPKYVSVASHGEIVGYVAASSIVTTPGVPVPALTPTPVYNSALTAVVGHMVPGDGFVPNAGSDLPATFAPGEAPVGSQLP